MPESRHIEITCIRLLSVAALITVAAVIYSCKESFSSLSIEAEDFVEFTTPGLVDDGKYVFEYDWWDSQRVVNMQRKTMRYQKDDQSAFVHAEFSAFPFETYYTQDVMEVKILYWKDSAVTLSKIVSMVVLKEEEMKFWLWNEEGKTGLIIDFK